MRKITAYAMVFAALTFPAGNALALDSDILREIRRADSIADLAKLAGELAERTASPERESRPVPSAEDLKIYLQLIEIKMDEAISSKQDKQHAETIKELKN